MRTLLAFVCLCNVASAGTIIQDRPFGGNLALPALEENGATLVFEITSLAGQVTYEQYTLAEDLDTLPIGSEWIINETTAPGMGIDWSEMERIVRGDRSYRVKVIDQDGGGLDFLGWRNQLLDEVRITLEDNWTVGAQWGYLARVQVIAPAPEPSSLALLLLGMCFVGRRHHAPHCRR